MQSNSASGAASMKKERSWMAVSAIQYRTDLIAVESPHIDLGFLLEIKAPVGTVLAMIVRKSLTAKEIESLDAIARIQLSDPARYLQAECSKAFAAITGDKVLEHLAKEHAWAFQIETPHQRDIPAAVAKLKQPATLVTRAIEWLTNEVKKAEQADHIVKNSARKIARRQSARKAHKPVARFASVSRASRRRDYACRVELGSLEMRI
jgi:hypothetical protein